MIRVSVIVPIYKVELYIERCVRSLMEQTMNSDIEFIFINDCTPDGSMDVLCRVIAEYPKRAEQVRIINHSENRGIAYTRAEGIREARGEYLGWCDSDDWCEKNMFEKMYLATELGSKDVVVCDYYRHLLKGTYYENSGDFKSLIEYMNSIYKVNLWQTFSVLYTKLIRRSICIENKIYPYEGINRSEDLNVMIRICCCAQNVRFLHIPLYHYDNTNYSSITHIGFSQKSDWEQQRKNVDLISCFLENHKPQGWRIIKAFLQFSCKNECRNYFVNKDDYFRIYRNCHWFILFFSCLPWRNRINMFLLYNIQPLYLLKN